MVSAREAAEKTANACEEIYKAILESVEEEIEDAIANGQYSCGYDGDIPESVKSMLVQEGYLVSQVTSVGSEIRYLISWGKK